MTWDTNKIIIAIILFALAALSVWLPNMLIKPVITLNSGQRHESDYQVENFTSTTMDEQGEPKYVLQAKHLTHYPDTDISTIDKPHLTQYAPDTPPVHTTADRGRIYNKGKELLMLGNVRITRGQNAASPGGEITTQELHIVLN